MRPPRGFTLVEVLVVLFVLGIAVALVQVRFGSSSAQVLDDEARRLALVLEFARDEAMTQGCIASWIVRGDSHRIECRRTPGAHAAHAWPHGMALERLSIAGVPVSPQSPLLFTPSGINPPFELVLSMEGNRVLLASDALGRVSVSR